LAETIVELGGKPSLKRGKQNMAGKTVPEWMSNDVGLEDGAIESYKQHIAIIDNPRIKRLLKRILADEQAHRGKFEHFIDKVKRENLKDIRGNRDDSVTKMLDWGITHEYTVVLQYMFHSYMTKNEEAKKQLEDQAINEMQHLGWLSEEMASGGGSPVVKHTTIDQSEKTADMLTVDLMVEKEVAAKYSQVIKETDDAGLKELLTRIRDNEQYHIEVFTDLLKEKKIK
jgi:bacterioferritin